MNRQVPTLGKLLTMVLFALSCFSLTLFLWMQFGGAIPFKAQGYRITTTFPEATQLATEADIRIAGVQIGRVKKVVPGANGRARVTLEVQKRFAPIPVGTKAQLRQKTLLGETYIALTPPKGAPKAFIAEGGRIPDSDILGTTELDELFSTFDPETRRAFQQWMIEGGAGLDGNGGNLGRALTEFQGTVSGLSRLSAALNDDLPALRSTLRNSQQVFDAATADPGALRRAVTENSRVFNQVGDQQAALTAFVNKLPAFLQATKTGTQSIAEFTENTGAAEERLAPVLAALDPATTALADAAPEINQLFTGLDRLNTASVKGLPGATQALKSAPVLFDGLDPFLKELNPIVGYASQFADPLAASFGNVAAVTGQREPRTTDRSYRDGLPGTAIRAGVAFQANGLAAANTRFSIDQANAYRRSNWAAAIGSTQLPQVYTPDSCGTAVPRIPDTTNADLNRLSSASPNKAGVAAKPDVSAIDALRYTLFDPLGFYGNSATDPVTPSTTPAPQTPTGAPRTCELQADFQLSAGSITTFPQLPAAPTSTRPSVTGN